MVRITPLTQSKRMSLSEKTHKELVALCKEKGIKGCSTKTKGDMVQLLSAPPASPIASPQPSSSAATTSIEIPPEVKAKLHTLLQMCKEVASTLKKGRSECVYQNAVCQELQRHNISYVSEETIPIAYKGTFVGIERIDICLTNWLDFIFELKAVGSKICPEHLWQVISYLNYKGFSYGAVVNFNQSVKGSLEVQFVVKQDNTWYMYDVFTSAGKRMDDYAL